MGVVGTCAVLDDDESMIGAAGNRGSPSDDDILCY
jgi:hypothetical protein